MTDVPRAVLDYWHRSFASDHASVHGAFSNAVSASLNPRRPAMMLTTADGSVRAVVRPEIAERAGIVAAENLSAEALNVRLEQVGVALHDPDYLFYLPPYESGAPDRAGEVRKLSEADRIAFDLFYHAASEQDRDDAWVELDHWAVFGCFDGDRLVSAASMNLWDDSAIADLGVLTLPDARGRGLGRAVVEAINRFSRAEGYEPQYRCQLDNQASVALAGSCGLTLFGQWIVAVEPAAAGGI